MWGKLNTNDKLNAKTGFHSDGLDFVQNGEKRHYAGKFIVTKTGQVINLNRQSNIYGHDITSRQYDSTQGVSSKTRGYDHNRRIPDRMTDRGVRNSKGKLALRYGSKYTPMDNEY